MLVPSSVFSVDIQLVSANFGFLGAHKIFFVHVGTVHIDQLYDLFLLIKSILKNYDLTI